MSVSKNFQKKMDQRLLYSLGFPKEPIFYITLPPAAHKIIMEKNSKFNSIRKWINVVDIIVCMLLITTLLLLVS